VIMIMVVGMIVPVGVIMVVGVGVAAHLLSFDRRLAAAADRAHHSTSNSATRMSSPDVI